MSKSPLKLRGSHLFKEIAEVSQSVWAPPPDMSMSQWADNFRVLSDYSALPGQWDTSRAEYQRDVMDSISDASVHEVVLMWASQLGKTDIELNTIGYYSHLDPCPMMLVLPEKETCRDFSKDRIGPMLKDTPVLREIFVDEKHGQDEKNTILRRRFKGGFLALVGSNKPADLASWPIRILLADEVDRYRASAGQEGDPIDLATKRATTFWNYKRVLTSSPGDADTSRIADAYEKTDQREYHVPCPHCQEFQTLEWENFRYQVNPETGELVEESVHMVCIHCGSLLYEGDKHYMISGGKWVAQFPSRKARGYRLSSLYSPWFRWVQMAREWLEAQAKPEQLKVFVNTRLGETWVQPGEGLNDDKIKERRETYLAPVPMGAFVLTASADVQKDRIEFQVVGWGLGEEAWIVHHKIIYGDTDRDDVWDLLEDELNRDYLHESGCRLSWSVAFIDAGYRTTKVYDFCKGREGRRIFAIIGRSGEGRPIVGPPSKKRTGKDQRQVDLYTLGIDQVKDILYSRIRKEEPGAASFHFPDWLPDEWFKQLAAEKLIVKYVKGFRRAEWINKRANKRNEALDLTVYCYAALKMLGPNWEAWKSRIIKTPDNPGQEINAQPKKRRIRSQGIR